MAIEKIMTTEDIKILLEDVRDPEIPVLNVLEMGIVRKVDFDGEKATVTITPTYSGCPAMEVIEDEIRIILAKAGIDTAVKSVLSPPWTTDWLTEGARQKLEDYGIAPPQGSVDKSSLFAEPKKIACPKCKSANSKMVSQFGSTACKAHYQCLDCLEPFDYFKCI